MKRNSVPQHGSPPKRSPSEEELECEGRKVIVVHSVEGGKVGMEMLPDGSYVSFQAKNGVVAKKKLLLIHTGGRMGMERLPDGSYVKTKGFFEREVRGFSENGHRDMPDFDMVEFDPLMESAGIGPDQWIMMASIIEENYLRYDGFVIIMGTDTMAYAASMLSFMLENLAKTVVFTSSKLQISDVYTDARRNLFVSMLFAANSNVPEVCIAFDTKILRGNRSVKFSSVSLDAFKSPNYPPLSDLANSIMVHRNSVLNLPNDRFAVHKNVVCNVIVIKLIPGFDDLSIYELIKHSTLLKAIIIEMYGTGNAPRRAGRGGLMDAIEEASAKGIVTVALSQCSEGGVDLSTYSMGRDFVGAGVISGGDMTTEACSTKLAYLFGRYKDPKVVASLVTQNLRGEITPQLEDIY